MARAFPGHVRQSIPEYDDIYRQFRGILEHWRNDSKIFMDVGTGTGEALLGLAPAFVAGDRAFGIDSSPDMLEVARLQSIQNVETQFVVADALEFEYPMFDVGIVTFTLSFISPQARRPLLSMLRRACAPSSILFFADKLSYKLPAIASFIKEDHMRFKRVSGIDDSDIAAKARSLQGVQEPATLEAYMEILRDSGWGDPVVIHVCKGFFACVALPE